MERWSGAPGLRLAPALIAVALIAACSTATDPFPRGGTITATLSDPGLSGQTGALSVQTDEWTIASLSATFSVLPDAYDFITDPCVFVDGARARGDLRVACGSSGVVLDATAPTTVTLHLELSSVRRFRADRPTLPATGDEDRDGVPNETDSCPIVWNPNQTGSSDYAECSIVGQPSLADQDLDGVSDAADNCRFVPNPADPRTSRQADADSNDIGDACQRQIPVLLPGGAPLRVDCPILNESGNPMPILPGDAALTPLTLEFADNAAFRCDPDLTTCTLDPAGVKILGNLRTPSATTSTSYSGACRPAS